LEKLLALTLVENQVQRGLSTTNELVFELCWLMNAFASEQDQILREVPAGFA
jgi:hypothetical protein